MYFQTQKPLGTSAAHSTVNPKRGVNRSFVNPNRWHRLHDRKIQGSSINHSLTLVRVNLSHVPVNYSTPSAFSPTGRNADSKKPRLDLIAGKPFNELAPNSRFNWFVVGPAEFIRLRGGKLGAEACAETTTCTSLSVTGAWQATGANYSAGLRRANRRATCERRRNWIYSDRSLGS